MEYVHINDLLHKIEFSAKERAEKSKILTENAITNNGKKTVLDFAKPQKRRT